MELEVYKDKLAQGIALMAQAQYEQAKILFENLLKDFPKERE